MRKQKLKQKRKPKLAGYWPKWENFEKDMKKAIEKNNGKFPTFSRLREMKCGYLEKVMLKYYGGVNTVREKMGYEPNRMNEGYISNWNNFKKEMEKTIKENDGKFPSHKTLTKMRKSGLSRAISKYHGGYQRVRKRMGYP